MTTEAIMARFEPRLRRWTMGYYIPDGDWEDVLQVARIGLWEAIRDHDPARPFPPFAKACVMRRLADELRRAHRHSHQVLTSATRETLVEVFHAPTSEPDRGLLEREHQDDLMRRARDNCSLFEWQVLCWRRREQSFEAIATKLGCTVKAVDNAISRAKRKLIRVQTGVLK